VNVVHNFTSLCEFRLIMPSIFKKLFGRKSKHTNLTDTAPINGGGNSSSILSTKKEKSKNKKSLKKQKKKDKRAHFPSKDQHLLALSNSSGTNDNNALLLLEGGDDAEKENSPTVASFLGKRGEPGREATRNTNKNDQYVVGNQSGLRNGAMPALTLPADETVPAVTSQSGHGNETSKTLVAHGPNILSPTMSGSKPPLTPNRLGNRGSSGKPLTPSSHRIAYPTPPPPQGRPMSLMNTPSPVTTYVSDLDKSYDSPISPDNGSLRGVHMATSAASDDMCLSSDNDDDEYNKIAHKENEAPQSVRTVHSSSKGGKQEEKYVSALDRSPFSYASDDDNALFPALVDDKDPFAEQDVVDDSLPLPNPRLNGKLSAGKGVNMNSDPDILPMAHESQDDIRAWTPSPTKKSTFTFSAGDKMVSPSAVAAARAGPKNNNNNTLFETFADFEPFDPVSQQRQFQSKSSSQSVTTNPISPVSAILEDSRKNRLCRDTANNGSRVGGSSSINSAPVITPSYIRAQVNRSKQHETTSSISKVIDNLELHVNKRDHKRQSHGSVNSGHGARDNSSLKDFVSEASSHRSQKSTESAIRELKERIRKETNLANESKMIDMLASGQHPPHSGKITGDNNWLFDEVTGTLGPRSVAADLESLGGRSNRSGKSRNSISNKSHRSKRGHRRQKSKDNGGDVSVDSRTSRNSKASYRSYQTTKSMVSQMSESSRSVANDLLRLEAQLAMVGKRTVGSGSSVATAELNKRRDDCGMTVTSRDYSISRSSAGGLPRPSKGSRHISASARRAAAMTLRSKVSVVAPPGKLGIILANRTDSRGTVVSGVRTSSVLADQVSPGDRIIAIDDEDVSQMNVKEITTIMARKSEFERVLVLLVAPKQQYD